MESFDNMLFLAVEDKDLITAYACLKFGAKVNAQDINGNTPLHLAVQKKDITMVKFLDIKGASWTVCNKGGKKPFQILDELRGLAEVIEHGDFDFAIKLVTKGLDVNIPTTNGQSPLQLACVRNQVKLVQVLLEAKAQVDFKSSTGQTPLCRAVNRNLYDIAALLIHHGANTNHKPQEKALPLLFLAVAKHRHDITRLLLTHGVDGNMRCSLYNWTALHFAAAQNDDKMIHILLDEKCEIDLPNDMRMTPLHWAVFHCSLAAASALLSRGADPSLQTKQGYSALELLFARRKDNEQHADLSRPKDWWLAGKLLVACPSLLENSALMQENASFLTEAGFDPTAFRYSRELWRTHAQDWVEWLKGQGMASVLGWIIMEYHDCWDTRLAFLNTSKRILVSSRR
jgi:ankyrin repeat protein